MNDMKKLVFSLIALCWGLVATAQLSAQEVVYNLVQNISYVSADEADAYRKERCKLDVYYPEGVKEFPTVIWFHGGGLEQGGKYIPELLKKKGIGVVSVNYRLSPKASYPMYIDDVAAAVAWTAKHIADYGGSAQKLYVSGHSAGGYLSLILATDKHYLAAYDIDADDLTAYLPVSGQTVTHFTIRKERGLPDGVPIVDEYAPVNHARKDTAPLILITGDRDLEMANRWEENAWLASVLKNVGNPNVKLYELQGFDHGTVHDPALLLIVNYIKQNEKKRK